MTLTPFEQIFVDMENKKYYRHRPDDLEREYHEMSIEQVVDLGRQLWRYEDDWRNEHYPTIK